MKLFYELFFFFTILCGMFFLGRGENRRKEKEKRKEIKKGVKVRMKWRFIESIPPEYSSQILNLTYLLCEGGREGEGERIPFALQSQFGNILHFLYNNKISMKFPFHCILFSLSPPPSLSPSPTLSFTWLVIQVSFFHLCYFSSLSWAFVCFLASFALLFWEFSHSFFGVLFCLVQFSFDFT